VRTHVFNTNTRVRILHSGSSLFVGKLLQLGGLLYIATLLGAYDFGIFSMLLAGCQLAVLLFTFGGQQGLTKIVSRCLAIRDFAQIYAITISSVAVMVLVALIAYGFLSFFSEKLPLGLPESYKVSALIGISMWIALREGIGRGFSLVVSTQITQEVISPLALILVLFVMPFGVYNVDLMISLWIGVYAVFEFVVCMWLFVRFSRKFVYQKPVFSFRSWVLELGSIQLAIVSKSLVTRSDILLTGWLLGPQAAGIYALAHRLAQPATLIARTLSAATSSQMSYFKSTQEFSQLKKVTRTALYFSVLGTSVFLLTLAFLGELVLGFSGEAYKAGYYVLVLLACAQGIDALNSPLSHLLMMSDYGLKLTHFNFIGAILFYLALCLGYFLGINGEMIAFSVLLAQMVINGLSALEARKFWVQL